MRMPPRTGMTMSIAVRHYSGNACRPSWQPEPQAKRYGVAALLAELAASQGKALEKFSRRQTLAARLLPFTDLQHTTAASDLHIAVAIRLKNSAGHSGN